jgi:prepilin-type N-terminal cleavage/methylation domain-containing protein
MCHAFSVSSPHEFNSLRGGVVMKKSAMGGFTLMELMFVMGIMAIIGGFAALSTDMIRRERVAGATRELYADLQKARLDAMTQGGKGFGIRLESQNSYVIFKFEDCNEDYTYDTNTCTGATREETNIIKRTLHSSLSLHKTNPSTNVNNDVRIFDRFGSPRQPTWGLGGITILVKNVPDSGLIKCISISASRIREALWNGSECI